MLRTIDDDFAALAEEVPGFGGMYFDTDGVLTIQLVNPEALAFARPKVVALLERGIRWGPGRTNQRAAVAREMRTVRARFDYRQLVSLYRTEVVPLMGTTEGITMTDIDERQNRIVVGVKDASTLAAIREHFANPRIPSNAVEVLLFNLPAAETVSRSAKTTTASLSMVNQSLQGDLRPAIPGGARIAVNYQNSIYTGTLGFNLMPWINGTPGTTRYLVTCSHCAWPLNQMQGVGVGQPTWSGQLAVEIVDPPAFPGVVGGWCPSQKICRWSEAALARYDDSTLADQGMIALPAIGSITFSSRVPIAVMDVPYVGQPVHMIGSQSGRRFGNVAQSCANVAHPQNSLLIMLCQARATYTSMTGDSGSPIIALYGNGTAGGIGIHWGSNGWFSILYQALDELYGASGGAYGVMDPVVPAP
jgi:hypothetical protein